MDPYRPGQSARWREIAESLYGLTGKKQRVFASFIYSAGSWDKPRRVIVKAEHSAYGANPRWVVTNLPQTDQYLYDKLYCARGDMENRIKDQQLDLFAGRVSCHRWWPNQFRQLLSGLAYTLFEGLRRKALEGTALAKASPHTIRLTLLKIGAVVIRNTRRVLERLYFETIRADGFKRTGAAAVQSLNENKQAGMKVQNGFTLSVDGILNDNGDELT